MKRFFSIIALVLIGFSGQISKANTAKVFRIFDQTHPKVFKVNGGAADGLKPGTILIAFDEQRTYGWVVLQEVSETLSTAVVKFEEVPGSIKMGLRLSMSVKPLAPAGQPGVPERADVQVHRTPWQTSEKMPASPLGEKRDGLHLLRRAVDMDPKNPQRYVTLADAMAERGDRREAIEVYKTAIRLNQDGELVNPSLLAIAENFEILGEHTLAHRYRKFVVKDQAKPEIPREPTKQVTVRETPEEIPTARVLEETRFTPEPAPTLAEERSWWEEDRLGRDPLNRPLNPRDKSGERAFSIQQVLVEQHTEGNDADDVSYQLLAWGKPLSSRWVIGALLMNRWNFSQGERDALYGGVNVTHAFGKRALGVATVVYTDYSGETAKTQNDNSRVSLSLNFPQPLGRGTLLAELGTSFGLRNSDDSWNAGLSYRQAISRVGAIEIGGRYTHNLTLDDSFLQEISAGYSHKMGSKGKLALEYTHSNPLFTVAPGSVRPEKDGIWRLSYTRVHQ